MSSSLHGSGHHSGATLNGDDDRERLIGGTGKGGRGGEGGGGSNTRLTNSRDRQTYKLVSLSASEDSDLDEIITGGRGSPIGGQGGLPDLNLAVPDHHQHRHRRKIRLKRFET